MKKRILGLICCLVSSCSSLPVVAIPAEQEAEIKDYCATIIEKLKAVQKIDARTRVFLGAHYETLISKYITPLNVKLVENNLSVSGLVENQSQFVENKTVFSNDYISYQKSLEELISIDCKNNPTLFYEKLVKVRQKRTTMEQDVLKMRNLLSEHIRLVNSVKEKL